MKSRPILFSAPMVRALLDGSKTQTRRVFKGGVPLTIDGVLANKCPYGQVGDQLWVRETYMDMRGTGIEHDVKGDYYYRADVTNWGAESRKDFGLKCKPSIFMPRAASRITLEITDVRVERLQDISEADAIAEGISEELMDLIQYGAELDNMCEPAPGKAAYATLWTDINGTDSWDLNPWVWVLEFKRTGVPA